jgi:hypothetical protein
MKCPALQAIIAKMIPNSRGGEYASARLLNWGISLSGNILKCYRHRVLINLKVAEVKSKVKKYTGSFLKFMHLPPIDEPRAISS